MQTRISVCADFAQYEHLNAWEGLQYQEQAQPYEYIHLQVLEKPVSRLYDELSSLFVLT